MDWEEISRDLARARIRDGLLPYQREVIDRLTPPPMPGAAAILDAAREELNRQLDAEIERIGVPREYYSTPEIRVARDPLSGDVSVGAVARPLRPMDVGAAVQVHDAHLTDRDIAGWRVQFGTDLLRNATFPQIDAELQAYAGPPEPRRPAPRTMSRWSVW